jgi:hypothetical protein
MALSRSFDKKYETDALGWCAFCSSDMSDESVIKLLAEMMSWVVIFQDLSTT